MPLYTVIGYERTTRMMKVEAESEEEAIEKAKAGEWIDIDTEPGPCLYKPAWRIE